MTDTLLDPHAAATRLGVNIHTMRRWCRDGKITAVKIGGGQGTGTRWRVPRSVVERIQREGMQREAEQ